VGYGENQIPGADAAGALCQLDRIRPIADTDAVGDPDESGESDLKGRDFSAQALTSRTRVMAASIAAPEIARQMALVIIKRQAQFIGKRVRPRRLDGVSNQ
jgi:hypothetical protein